MCSVVQSCPTLCQALLSKGFSRQGHWSGLPFPSPGDLPRPGTEPMSSVSLASAGRFFTTVPPVKPARISANLKKQGKGFPETWEQRHGVRISFTQGEGGLAVPVWIQEEEFLICKHSLKEASILSAHIPPTWGRKPHGYKGSG